VTRYAIGDLQGCLEPLQQLLEQLAFEPQRDHLLFVGDLVNRGPDSLAVLRFVRSLGAAARTVLGNHDLHLLALHHDPDRRQREGDTLDDVLGAPDRGALMDWLLLQPLVIDDATHGDLIVHAGVVPQWNRVQLLTHARAAEGALRADPRDFLSGMYGNKPDRWEDAKSPMEQHRFTINVLTRMRYCHADGRIDLKIKGAPGSARGAWRPWFEHGNHLLTDRRIVFGHWSTLGLLREPRHLALDTGCVWGGSLTAVNLDDPSAPPVQQACRAFQKPDEG
jgi:bis(5'-nucleosyl)-tetraphosphatase (symmetrical)